MHNGVSFVLVLVADGDAIAAFPAGAAVDSREAAAADDRAQAGIADRPFERESERMRARVVAELGGKCHGGVSGREDRVRG